MIRVIPSLAPTYEWMKLMGFVGQHRAAEGLFYHRDFGPAGSFPVFVSELAKGEAAAAPLRLADAA